MKSIKLALLALLFAASPLRAVEVPQGAIEVFINFSQSKGLFNYLNSVESPPDTAQDISNIDFKRNQNLSPRFHIGPTIISGGDKNSIAGFKNSLSIFVSTTNNAYIVGRVDDRPFASTSGFEQNPVGRDIGDPTFFALGQRQSDEITINNAHYLINEASGIIKYNVEDNSANRFVGLFGTPQGKYASSFLGSLLISGSTIAIRANRISYSTSTNVEQFPISNFLDIQGGDTGITGLGAPLLGVMPIYTQSTTRMLTGTVFPESGTPGNVAVRTVSETVGCIHHRTIENRNNQQLFFSAGQYNTAPGIYAFNGVGVQELTKFIRPYFIDNINITTTPIPSAFVYKNEYCLEVATKTGLHVDTQICLDENNRIRISTGFPLDDLSTYKGVAYMIETATISATGVLPAGKVIKYDLSYATIPWAYKTKDYDMGQQQQGNIRSNQKTANRAYIDFENKAGTITVIANFDFGLSSQTFVINTSTSYKSGTIDTVLKTSDRIINKLTFNLGKKFNFVNFELKGDNDSSINSIDFYAVLEPRY